MKGHGSKFGRKKEAAIAALLSQKSIEDAARLVGIGANTLLRWMQLPEFQAAYGKARRAAVSQTNARLQQATGAAAMMILKLMVDANAPSSVRLRAAGCVLDYAAKAIEMEDIDRRVTVLEQAAQGRKPKYTPPAGNQEGPMSKPTGAAERSE